MSLPTLTFSGLTWLWLVAGLLALALGALAWSYRALPPSGWRGLCATLKILGILTLALCLLEPFWSTQRARPGANLFALLADNSQSLQIHDPGQSPSRGAWLRRQLDPEHADWPRLLAEHFDVRRFAFDAQWRDLRDLQDLTFDGRASALAPALRALADRFAGRPLAGLLLFTDGNTTDPPDAFATLPQLPPIYPVLVGQPGAVRDLALGPIQVSQSAFEDAPVTVRAEVTATGLAGETVVAHLTDPATGQRAEQTQRVPQAAARLAFHFPWRPAPPGLSFPHLRVALRGESAADPSQPSREATLANNQRRLAIERDRGPYRLLYVTGRPNWEYKYLNRALRADAQLELVALLRVAQREPKFAFRGRGGETGNPLFRGFGDQAREAVERYDQPVLLRLNTRDELELRGGFPRTAEELYGYDALILDDVEAAFFAPDQAALVRRFVAERGGGLLMLGGQETFAAGQYARTPIGELLPVYLDRPLAPAWSGGLKLTLTRAGWLEPWARWREREEEQAAALQSLPPFHVANAVRDLKPGAQLLATLSDPKGQAHPALVTQRFGHGRTAALLIGDLWRWGMTSPEARADFEKFWRQLARWLVADTPRRVALTVEAPAEPAAGAVNLCVRVRDAQFQPVDDATVQVEVTPVPADAGTKTSGPVRLRAEPSSAEPGLYEVTYVARQTGGYRALASVTNAVGADLGRPEAGWSVDLTADEFRSLTPDRARLEDLARRTGGRMIAAEQLTEFARQLPRRPAPVMEPWLTPAWHTPAWFAFALACLAAEWGVRRWKGWP